jgi:GTPase SAR1 family protein
VIDQFEVEKFKLFENFKLEGLGRVNLIVGANNCGKTSLLEALYLEGRQDLAAAVVDVMKQRRQSGKPNIDGFLRDCWGGRDRLWNLGRCNVRFESSQLIKRDLRGSCILEVLDSLDNVEAKLSRVRGPGWDCLAIWQSGLDETLRDNYWDQLVLDGDNEKIVELMQLVEPSIQRIGLKNDGHTLRQPYYRDKLGQEYPLGRLGLGMARLLGLAFGLYYSKGGRLIVDEIETGLYFDVQEKVWDWIFTVAAKLDVQVFAATHSLDCVRAFSMAAITSPEEGRLFRLDRKFGQLRAVAYDEEKLQIAAEQGIEVR